MNTETWKDVVDYEGIYKVSSLGRIKSINRKDSLGHRRNEKVLKPKISKHGYNVVILCKNGVVSHHLLHRLIAIAFIENDNSLPQVNHKDENKLNNRVDNLEWCDSKYNINYGTNRERANNKLYKKVNQLTLDGMIVNTYNSMKETELYGFSKTCVSLCCANKIKTHKGYIWKYHITKGGE